ncbi:hypothetical protein [Novipirellula artificiosorum]|uniref:hypothetical protein n=1 Tax=Novipirellula artificiosorum TaxID=2528016 RepID=UPI0011B6224C|nr:hypothetical protein [Novipirellula artificiosorum]
MKFLLAPALGLAIGCSLVVTVVLSPAARAGVVPENVMVVVNADSVPSRTLANHYCELRDIPTNNVILLDDVPKGLTIELLDFKERILMPILKTLDERGLAAQAKVIAYSAGFPAAVKIDEHTAKLDDSTAKKYQLPTASLTGLTFFYRFILADQFSYLGWESNLYARGKFDRTFRNPFSGTEAEEFDKAITEMASGDAPQAAETLKRLHGSHLTLSAVAIKSAEAYSAADDQDAALLMLKKAIAAGWSYPRYLKETPALKKLSTEPEIAAAMEGMANMPISMQGPVGFSALRGWMASGEAVPVNQGGVSYLMSCMLGAVYPNGSSIRQAVDVLDRSATCDRTYPDGEFLFSLTGDVRTTTRMPGFADALVYLAEQGKTAKITRGSLPTGKNRVNGLMLGTATFDLLTKKWSFAPGAIAENLTSLGAAYTTSSQTKLNELLHAGAVMSSGSVTEPYSLQFKFPHPMMYAYYAEGVTAIEAYYLSITSPYQTLIVGDPLCQPFARPPVDQVDMSLQSAVGADAQLVNTVRIRRSEKTASVDANPKPTKAHHVELFVNGKMMQVARPLQNYNLRFPAKLSGELEIAVAVSGNHPAEPMMRFSQSFEAPGDFAVPVLKTEFDPKESLRSVVDVQCEGADSIEIQYFADTIATVSGQKGSETIDRSVLGDGPLRLRAVAVFVGDDGNAIAKIQGKRVVVLPVEIESDVTTVQD